jgi:hypothetical protein
LTLIIKAAAVCRRSCIRSDHVSAHRLSGPHRVGPVAA